MTHGCLAPSRTTNSKAETPGEGKDILDRCKWIRIGVTPKVARLSCVAKLRG